MFWLDGYQRYRNPSVAGWCLALTLLGSLVIAERSSDLNNSVGVHSSAMPAFEICDAANESIAQRLTQANLQFNILASYLVLPRDIQTQFSQYGSPAVQKRVPKSRTLVNLGTLLRL